MSFQTQSAASLKPASTSHTVLLRQNDGSYTGYEMADASPYQVLKTTPNFQNQLTVCPPPSSGLTAGPPQAFAQLQGGRYLFVQRSDAFGIPGSYSAVNVVELDAALRLISQSSLMLSAGPMNPGGASTLTLTDVNGDGLPDLIAGAGYPHTAGIQVLLGNGHSGFGNPAIYGVPGELNIASTVVADVNGDNKPDILVAGSWTGQIWLFLGNGDGTFQPPKPVAPIPAAGLGKLKAIAVGDVNGDKKPDLVFTTNLPPATINVAIGDGNGNFSTAVSFPSGGTDAVAIGDVNGDGLPDIVASGISILFGDGKGGFPSRQDYFQQTMGSIILTDFNNDGRTDIVIGTGAPWVFSGTAIAVMYGSTGGMFSGAPITTVPGFSVPGDVVTSISSADLDGDGIADVIFSDILTGITSLKGSGDGNFKAIWQYNPRTQENVRGVPASIVIGDFNRDGVPDFAAVLDSTTTGVIEVFLGIGDGTFQSPLIISAGSSLSDYSSIVSGDFNGDGKLDLAVANRTSKSVAILLGDGTGAFTATSGVTGLTLASFVAVGDFNNDGKQDL
ncbi:MAG: VCBS repeat-containing protein, partial [Bryobacterales bacterium]|nr:VCBS repeat-containing protein [Bryobacterales bacterium]